MQERIDIARLILLDREKGTLRLVAEYRDRLHAVAFALCRNHAEAEDLAFRTIERAVSKIESYEERDSFYEWLQIILLNLYRNSVRGKMVRSTMAAGGGQDLEDISGKIQELDVESAEKVYAAVDSAILRDAINRLPDDMKEMVILRYFMDMPLKKMAQILSMPVGTVMSRLYYARLVLAKRLGTVVKKPAVAIVAAVLMLLGIAAAVVVDIVKLRMENGELENCGETLGGAIPTASQLASSSGIQPLSTTYHLLPATYHLNGETIMKNGKAVVAALSAAVATAPLAAANGDGYQFVVSGELVAVTEGCSSDSSLTAALESGPLADGVVFDSELEARCRTTEESNTCSLLSDKVGMMILVK